MGVDLGKIVYKEEITFDELKGKWVAVDAFNIIYQFLASIRQEDGTPLKDFKGRITAHLSGLFYRNAKLMSNGLKLAYVFDGTAHKFKEAEQTERRLVREHAKKKWKEALDKGDLIAAKKYAQGAITITTEIIEECKELLEYMGIPVIDAPSDGEAQAAQMVQKNVAYAVASQDYDSMLYGAPRAIRNLSISGRRKIRGRTVIIHPEIIYLNKTLEKLGITREQLVYAAILIGTDFNEGVKGIGPKTAIKLVKEKSLDEIIEHVEEKYDHIFEHPPKLIAEIFLNPEYKECKLKQGNLDEEKIINLMVKKHDFSEERIKKTLDNLKEKLKEQKGQSTLDSFF